MTDEQLQVIRARISEIRAKRGPLRIEPDPAPRYDDVFFEGVAWLDSLSGIDSENLGITQTLEIESMTPEMISLARTAMSHPDWRWTTSMRFFSWTSGEIPGVPDDDDSSDTSVVPDIRDPGTLASIDAILGAGWRGDNAR